MGSMLILIIVLLSLFNKYNVIIAVNPGADFEN